MNLFEYQDLKYKDLRLFSEIVAFDAVAEQAVMGAIEQALLAQFLDFVQRHPLHKLHLVGLEAQLLDGNVASH